MRPPSDLPRHRNAARFGRRGRNVVLVVVLGTVVAFEMARWLARLATDSWWFDSLGQRAVLSTMSRARVELGAVSGLLAACVLYGCLLVVDRTLPLGRGSGQIDQLVARYQVLVAEHGLAVRLMASGAFGAIAALPVAARWQQWLLFRHAVSFGKVDDVYGFDLGFFVFRLPFLLFIVEWLFTVLMVASLLSLAAHYLSGTLHLVGPRRAAPTVRLHLSVLIVAMALVRAVAYWLHRYALVTSTRGYVRGLSYTDEHHVRPALGLLVLVALTAALLVGVGLRLRSWRLPSVAMALWAVVALTSTAVFPAVVQRVVSRDAPSVRERGVIERNLRATRFALGLDTAHLDTVPVVASDAVREPDALANLADVRLISTGVASLAMTSTGGGVGAPAMLPEVGRYVVGDRTELVYVGVPASDAGAKAGWTVRHRTQVTAAAPALVQASAVTADGRALSPAARGKLAVRAGPIYVAEDAAPYAVIAAGVPQPAALAAVSAASTARRVAFALRFGDIGVLQHVNDDDRLLYVRKVADRVRTLAPFLAWDAHAYPVVADGQLQWVVDGYTTSDAYPAAERADTNGLSRPSGLRRPFNYVRNSVKAVLDAHTGGVTLYASDPADPVLAAWSGAFPRLFEPWASLSGDVKAQLRYPLDLLRLQSSMWGRYRTDDSLAGDVPTFAELKGRWTDAPRTVVGQPLVSATTTVSVTPTTARARTTTSAAPAVRKPAMVEPSYAVWDGRMVAVVPMVAADRPNQQNLAALVAGTVGTDGVPHLQIRRLDAPVPSPGAARAALMSEIVAIVPDVTEDDVGELQAVPVAGTVAWALPWYLAARKQLGGVALLADGKVRLRASIESAAQALFGVDPGFTTARGGSGPTLPAPSAPELTPAELMAKAQDLYRQAAQRFAVADQAGGIARLKEAFQAAAEAARRLDETVKATVPPSVAAPTTTSPPAVSTTSSTAPSPSTTSRGTTT